MFISENKLRKIIKEILIEGYAESGFLGDINDVDEDLNTHAGSYEDVLNLVDDHNLIDDETEWTSLDYEKSVYTRKDQVVKDILRLRRSGLSLGKIVDELNKLGHRTKKGKPILPSHVSILLKKFSTEQDIEIANQNRIDRRYKTHRTDRRYRKRAYRREDPLVKDILRLRKEGLTFSKIADKLNKLGYKTINDNPISIDQIHQLFKKFSTEQDIEIADQNRTRTHRNRVHVYRREDHLVKDILKLRRSGLSLDEITDELNKLEYRTKNNTPITVSQIYKIINRFSTEQDIEIADQNRTHRKRAYSREDPLVKDILRLSKEGLSTSKISAELNKLGYKTNKGTPIARSQISRIINNFNNE